MSRPNSELTPDQITRKRATDRRRYAREAPKLRKTLRDWRHRNKEVYDLRRKVHRQENLASERAKDRADYRRNRGSRAAYSRLRRTGMSDEMYRSLIQLQKDACAVCKRPFALGRRCADHDHETKEPRGLLCIHCNAIEGHSKAVGLAPSDLGARLCAYLLRTPVSRLQHAS